MNDSPERYLRTVNDQGEEILHELSPEMLGHYWRHQWLDEQEALTALLLLLGEFQQALAQLTPNGQHLEEADPLPTLLEKLSLSPGPRGETRPTATPIRVAIAENDQLVREGMRRLLGDHDDLVLVGQVEQGDHLFPLLAGTPVDVLILGGHLPQNYQLPLLPFAVVAAVKEMAERYPETAVVFVARHYVPFLGHALALAQVRGFLFHEDKLALQLAEAVRTVHNGGTFLSETASQQLFHPSDMGKLQALSEQQIALLSLLATHPHTTRRQQARYLGLTEHTFDSHLQRLYRQLGVRNQLAVVVRAIQLGLLRIEELG